MAWIAGQILQAVADFHEVGQTFVNIDQIAEKTALGKKRISESAAGLIKLGFLERAETAGHYALTEAGRIALAEGTAHLKSGPKGAMPRKTPVGLRAKAWRAMRLKVKFTLADIMEIVCTGEEKDAESNLGKYVQMLKLTGYLIELPRKAKGDAPTSNGLARYLLERNSGPVAPVWRAKDKVMFDPNTEREWAIVKPVGGVSSPDKSRLETAPTLEEAPA